MFDQLSDRLQETLAGVRSRGKLTEADVDSAMREIRLGLLEADVNFKVVKEFVESVRKAAAGADVLRSLTPGQQVVKVVKEELVNFEYVEILPMDIGTMDFYAKSGEISKAVRVSLKYGFFRNREKIYGGHNDYDAHLVLATMQYRF